MGGHISMETCSFGGRKTMKKRGQDGGGVAKGPPCEEFEVVGALGQNSGALSKGSGTLPPSLDFARRLITV